MHELRNDQIETLEEVRFQMIQTGPVVSSGVIVGKETWYLCCNKLQR